MLRLRNAVGSEDYAKNQMTNCANIRETKLGNIFFYEFLCIQRKIVKMKIDGLGLFLASALVASLGYMIEEKLLQSCNIR